MIKYCFNCGTQLNEGIKFCTKCGQAIADAKAKAPTVIRVVQQKSTNIGNWIIVCIGGAILLAAVLYFTGVLKPKSSNNITSTNTNTEKNSTTTETVATVSEEGNANAEQKVKEYYERSLNLNAEQLYNDYLRYCTKYYNLLRPTKSQVIKDMNDYWSKVSEIEQNIKLVTVTNYQNTYQALITMDYSFYSAKESQRKYINNLKTRMVLDGNFNIIEVYELGRE